VNPICPKGNKVGFVRYADDLLMIVVGPHRLAENALNCLKDSLKTLGLECKERKTHIVHGKCGVIFLGAKIRVGKTALISKLKRGGTKRAYTNLGLQVSILYLCKSLEKKGFVKYNAKYKQYNGTFKGRLINKDHDEIIRYFNSVILGVSNYYCFATNR